MRFRWMRWRRSRFDLPRSCSFFPVRWDLAGQLINWLETPLAFNGGLEIELVTFCEKQHVA